MKGGGWGRGGDWVGGGVVEEARQGGVAAVLAAGERGDGERGSGWGCGVWCVRGQ